jgi:hypothetical protein
MGGNKMAWLPPYLAFAAVAGIFLFGQIQATGKTGARLDDLEEHTQLILQQHQAMLEQLARQGECSEAIQRRLARIEGLLDRRLNGGSK